MNQNEPCLRYRNQTTRDQETACYYYQKRFRGYLRYCLINHQTVSLLLGVALLGLLLWLTRTWLDEDPWAFYGLAGLGGLLLFFGLGQLLLRLWFWRYTKHVVVTNEGIWLMWHGLFWRKKDFRGKRRFASPRWSLYSWGEIKLTANPQARPHSPVPLANFGENFDYAIIKSTRLTSLFITRFDGVEAINFLAPADAQAILDYAKTQRRRPKTNQ